MAAVLKDAAPARHETFLRVKSAESTDGERWITAWASTPDEDLQGDIVLPAGARYTLPIPLLAYHRHDAPVGTVTEAHISERGIRIRARLTKGVQLADELWNLLRDGAVSAVSIGFKPLQSKPLPSGGLLFEVWRWLELSLTPVPANPSARVISVGKGIAYGTHTPKPVAPAPPQGPRYVPVRGDIRADFECAAASLGETAARRADPRTSSIVDGHWHLRAFDGEPIAIVSPAGATSKAAPAIPPKPAPVNRAAVGVTRKELEATITGVVNGIAEGVAAKTQDLMARIEALEAAIAEAGIRFKGFHRDGAAYRLGDAVTNDGSLWIAVRPTNEPPAATSPDWCLAARKGRDAK